MQPPADIPVPSPRAPWNTIWHFALSVNGYDAYDGDLADLEGLVRAQWDQSRSFPEDVATLRYALFFLQRSFRWNDATPEGDDAVYVRAIVARIGELSGGVVDGPHDLEDQERRVTLEDAGLIDVDELPQPWLGQ